MLHVPDTNWHSGRPPPARQMVTAPSHNATVVVPSSATWPSNWVPRTPIVAVGVLIE